MEEWNRSFAGRPLVSRQWKHADGLLSEHMGGLEQRFRLNAVEGSLRYQNESATVRLGPIIVPLPRWLAPRVTASETQVGDAVAVETSSPFVGLLIAYEETITIEESSSG